MNLKIGIVGLPNVGKSTLFNALTKSAKAEAANFPFCTIDPNVGIVNVPDKRLQKLTELVTPEKVIPATVEFVDIAGLVAGASSGEGLGNQFLSHIRECHAICHVVRAFEDEDVHHVAGKVDPAEDLDVIMTELIMADLQSVEKQLDRVGRKARTGDKDSKREADLLTKTKELLEAGKMARDMEALGEDDAKLFKNFHLLTVKPYLVVANVKESEFANFDTNGFGQKLNVSSAIPVVAICAKVEAELCDLEEEDAQMFLEELGASESGLENLIHEGYRLLGLETYFTAGVKEVRAWTIRKGSTAPQAAGEIHTDFEKGFIKADTIAYDDFVVHGGEAGAKEAGKMRMEGKEYIVKDGDIMHFKFNN